MSALREREGPAIRIAVDDSDNSFIRSAFGHATLSGFYQVHLFIRPSKSTAIFPVSSDSRFTTLCAPAYSTTVVIILGIMPLILPSFNFHPQPKLLIPSLFLRGSIAYVWGKPALSTELIIEVFALSIKFPIAFSKSFIFCFFHCLRLPLCGYNGETTPANNLVSRAEEKRYVSKPERYGKQRNASHRGLFHLGPQVCRDNASLDMRDSVLLVYLQQAFHPRHGKRYPPAKGN